MHKHELRARFGNSEVELISKQHTGHLLILLIDSVMQDSLEEINFKITARELPETMTTFGNKRGLV